MQADRVVDLLDLRLLDAERRPELVVALVGKGDHRVQPVVAAGHLNDDEHRVLAGLGRASSPRQEFGNRAAEG